MAYKRILVPVDGSPTSGLCLREAIAFAKAQKARLALVHVIVCTTVCWPAREAVPTWQISSKPWSSGGDESSRRPPNSRARPD